MADLMNDVIDQAAEMMENAGMQTQILEPVVTETAKKFDLKSAICGTVVGAAGAVLVRKAIQAVKANKDEIKQETDKVKKEKLEKKMEKLAKKLHDLDEPVDEDDLDEDFDDEEIVEE